MNTTKGLFSVSAVAGLSIFLVALAISASPPLATSVVAASQCTPNNPQTIVSDTSTQVNEGDSVAVSPINANWTASFPPAIWIWGENPVEDPVNGATEVFSKNFTISGTPSDSTLEIAGDNSFSVSVNGNDVPACDDVTGSTFGSPITCTIPAADLLNGSNTITFTVNNFPGGEGATADSNPAGLLYNLSINSEICPQPPANITVVASKVVCQDTSDLPAWGTGGHAPITSTTASDWVLDHKSCALTPGWTFEYGDSSTGDGGDTTIGHVNGYTPFGPTDSSGYATTTIPLSALNGGSVFHLREELQTGYIPFTFDAASTTPNGNPVSAQFYCASDALNYDNYDFITNPATSTTYYCVAFNAPVPAPGPQNTCVDPNATGAPESPITFGTSLEPTLQSILTTNGYTLNAETDQKNYQTWDDSGNTVDFTVKVLAKYASYTHVFGYYTGGDVNTFVPVFADASAPAPYDSVPVKSAGDTVSFSVPNVGTPGVGFAIKAYSGSTLVSTWATQESLNTDSTNHAVVYNPNSNEYVLGFEDLSNGGDNDFNDLVVSLTMNMCAAPTGPFTVTIDKFIDGEQATSDSANGDSFPMLATWNDPTGIGAGSGSYALSPIGFNSSNPYEAVTAAMNSGASYTTSEDTSGAVVGSSCESGDPYALVGYTTGTTLAEAQNATPSADVPNFASLSNNEYVIVWNQSCEVSPPPSTVVVNIYKYLSDGETEAQIPDNTNIEYLFPMEATWTAANLDNGAQTSGSYQLGNDYGHPAEGMNYTASTSPMDVGADYATHEVTTSEDSNSLVLPPDALCQPGDYKLLGYQVGDTLADAQNAALSTTTPSLTDIQNDKYIIVVNQQCGDKPQVLTSTVTMCKFDNSDPANALSGWTLTLKGTSIDDLSIISNSIDGADTSSLDSGTSYLATVTGTWTNSNINVADAGYASSDTWATHVQGDPTFGAGEYQTQVNDGFIDWGPYSSTHTYQYAFTPSSDGSYNFRIFDGDGNTGIANPDWYGDNTGSLSLDISPGFMGTTGDNGCVTFDNVPYGTYTAGEVAQDGWTNVSGNGSTVVVNAPTTPEVDIVNHDNNSCTIVSDTNTFDSTDSHDAVALSFINSAWTATSNPTPFDPSAVWIWGEDPATGTDVNKTEVFTRTFDIVGTPTSGSIDIGADNGFVLKVNGNTVVDESAEEHNYEASKHYDISSYLVTGTNVVEFDVTNFGVAGSDASSNPAGLVYQIHLPDNQCTNPGEGETGTLEVQKTIVGNSDASPSDFAFDVTGSTDGTGSDIAFNSNGINDMTLATDQNYTVDEVANGDYTTTYSNNENDTANCDNLTLPAICYVTNTFNGGNGGNNPATLTIVKNTTNGDGTFTFDVATSTEGGGTESVDVTTTDGSGNSDAISLAPGTYNVTEEIPHGWNLSDVSCVYNNDSVGSEITNGEQIYVDSGDSVTCTFSDTASTNVERTIVVHQEDLTTSPFSNPNSWSFYNDQTNTLDNTLGSFVDGPNTAPLGNGSAQISATSTQGILFATLGYEGTPLSEVTSLQYSTYRSAGDSPLALALQFEINTDGTTSPAYYQGRLVFEPYLTGATVETNTWQNWDTSTGAGWWFSHASNTPGNGLVVTTCTQATPCTWSQVRSAFPNIGISGITGFKAGSGWSSDFTGNVDDFVITTNDGTNATTTTYDFEPTDSTPPNNPGPNTQDIVPGPGGNGPVFDSVAGGPEGQVLGASTSTSPGSCTEYLTAFIKFGGNNDPAQVTRLQEFLNQFEGDNLTVNGIYDQATLNALEAFQAKYASDILTPWGETSPTGFVYLTTRREVNIIYCNYTLQFPLTPEQIAEIDAYKAEFGNGGGGNGGTHSDNGNNASSTDNENNGTENSSSTNPGLGQVGGAGAAGGGLWGFILHLFGH